MKNANEERSRFVIVHYNDLRPRCQASVACLSCTRRTGVIWSRSGEFNTRYTNVMNDSMNAPARVPLPASQTPPRLRLDYLDGIRALCALLVVAGHTGDGGFLSRAGVSAPVPLRLLFALFGYDRYAVAVFIILSGYCLMMPVVRDAEGRFQGGVKGFFARRARRILPPYYAALAFAVLLACTLPGYASPRDLHADNLLAHLFLIHNLLPKWRFALDGPMWSVSTEAEIYALFAFVLLPLWRWRGIRVVLPVAFGIGLLPHFALHKWLDPVAPWYAGLFALGMTGALVSFSPRSHWRKWRDKLAWGRLCGGLSLCLLLVFLLKPARLLSYPLYIMEPLVGLTAMCGLIHYTRLLLARQENETANSARPPLLRFLESPPLVRLGLFSYSIYLMHAPLFALALPPLRRFALPPYIGLLLVWVLCLPVVLLGCYLFHCLFERPFMSGQARRTTVHLQ